MGQPGMLRALGARDPGSNPGSPILFAVGEQVRSEARNRATRANKIKFNTKTKNTQNGKDKKNEKCRKIRRKIWSDLKRKNKTGRKETKKKADLPIL